MDIRKRNEALKKALREHTAAIISDPKKLAAWAAEQRKARADYEAYMALETHDGNCHCARCMSEFLAVRP